MQIENYRIVRERSFGLFVVKPNIGVLPVSLSGLFQNPTIAAEAVNRYIRTKREEAEKPAPVKKVKLTPRGEVNATEGDSEG